MHWDVSEEHVKREKEKARRLRKSRWWQTKLQDPLCYYCARSIPREQATMDHIVPISEGGRSTRGNVVVCCKSCNTKKKDMTAVEWALYLDSLKD